MLMHNNKTQDACANNTSVPTKINNKEGGSYDLTQK